MTNVAKYAHASHATVSVRRTNGHATVTVADDGIGGADPDLGTGLRGLADRVEALDGRLESIARRRAAPASAPRSPAGSCDPQARSSSGRLQGSGQRRLGGVVGVPAAAVVRRPLR